MERTISFMNGKGSIGHNTRSFIADNVDASRTKNNITLIHEDIRQSECFGLPCAILRERRVSNMLKMSDTPIRGFLPFFANVGLQVAFLVPTPTGYQKSIMDATLPLREMLREAGIHNYAEQKQGPKFKALVKTYYLK